MRTRSLGLVLVLLVSAGSARAEVPRDGRAAPGEDPAKTPLQVCGDIVRSARSGEVDGILRRISEYGRARFGWLERVALSFAKGRIAGCTCSDVELDGDDKAMVLVENPSEGKTRMPFIRESGFWRFDVKRWQELRKKGQGGL